VLPFAEHSFATHTGLPRRIKDQPRRQWRLAGRWYRGIGGELRRVGRVSTAPDTNPNPDPPCGESSGAYPPVRPVPEPAAACRYDDLIMDDPSGLEFEDLVRLFIRYLALRRHRPTSHAAEETLPFQAAPAMRGGTGRVMFTGGFEADVGGIAASRRYFLFRFFLLLCALLRDTRRGIT